MKTYKEEIEQDLSDVLIRFYSVVFGVCLFIYLYYL